MWKNPPKYKKRIIYPLLFALVIVESLLMFLPTCSITYGLICDYYRNQMTRDELISISILWGLVLCYVVVVVIEGYYYLGIYELRKDTIIITSPLRRKIKIAFTDVKYIGVDYSLIRGRHEFWIYISKVPIKQKYWNNIAKLRFTRSTVRILYTPERFAEFISILPPHLSKELQKGVSMLRKFKVDTSIDI